MDLLEEIGARERQRQKADSLRAGLIAAAIYNVNRKRGSRALTASDFVEEEPVILSAEQMEAEFARWAKAVNRTVKA